MVTLDDLMYEIKGLRSQVGVVVTRLDAIESKQAEPPVTPPSATVPSDIWDGLKLNDPLAEYEVLPEGWINRNLTFLDYPGDKVILKTAWLGVEAPTGRVMHAGDKTGLVAARTEALKLRAMAASAEGAYGATAWGLANVAPECAAVLMLLRYCDIDQTFKLGSHGLGAERWANTVSLESLFSRLKEAALGGAPSGGQ